VVGVLVNLGSAVLVWQASRLRARPGRYRWHWPFWCTLAGFIAFAIVAPDGPIHAYVITSRSMAPTLAAGERIWADQRTGQTLVRGDLVIVLDDSNFARVERIVGLGGDRVALKDGVVILGGQPVPQRAAPAGSTGAGAGAGARMLMEQLPGRPAHRILDTAATPQDDMAEQLVPKDHVFVLGDNRDDSLDSRFPAAMNGLGMVHQDRLLGRVFLIYWSDDRARIGRVP
jgi:signal peptidase I